MVIWDELLRAIPRPVLAFIADVLGTFAVYRAYLPRPSAIRCKTDR